MNQIEEMQAFVRIVEAGSISKAADQLNIVKSALSRRLKELERRLGVSLLTRTTRKQVLTDSGHRYYLQCLRIIDDIAEVEARIRNEHCALEGRIKIALPLSFGVKQLSTVIREFNHLHPEVVFEIDFNDRKMDLIEEGFDLAVRISRLEDSNLVARKMTSSQMLLLASEKYLNVSGKLEKPSDLLQGHVRISYKNAPDYWSFVDDRGHPVEIKMPSIMTVNNGDYLCQAAVEGQGIVYLPEFICYQQVKQGLLQPILTNYVQPETIEAYVIYPQSRHLSKRVRSLVDYLLKHFSGKPPWSLGILG